MVSQGSEEQAVQIPGKGVFLAEQSRVIRQKTMCVCMNPQGDTWLE